MKIIITGGAGFIGSHLILRWIRTRPNVTILNLDKLGYASNLAYLREVEDNPRYQFVQLDISDRKAVHEAIQEFQPDAIVHLAAESHVDNSIRDPQAFLTSNVTGTFNLLEESRQFWSMGNSKLARFHHVSTDEVFGSLGESGAFGEDTPYAPNSPYSASKASSDHWVRAYHRTYGLNAVITNCSNNFGPHQHDEKLIPTVIRSAVRNKPIPVYGNGKNTRDWLYVEDHCAAILTAFETGRSGESYNIGSHNEWNNLALVKHICSILDRTDGRGQMDSYSHLIKFVDDRAGHDLRYAIDSSKITNELGWTPKHGFDEALVATVAWYVDRYREESRE